MEKGLNIMDFHATRLRRVRDDMCAVMKAMEDACKTGNVSEEQRLRFQVRCESLHGSYASAICTKDDWREPEDSPMNLDDSTVAIDLAETKHQ